MSKKWTEMSDEAFAQLLDNMSTAEYGELTDVEFFGALAAMDVADEIHLTGRIENGQLVFDDPAPLPVKGNVIQLGPKRIVIDVRSPS